MESIQKKKAEEKIAERKMKHYNTITLLKLALHRPSEWGLERDRLFFFEVTDGIYLKELKREVTHRIEAKEKIKLLWLSAEGDVIPIDSQQVISPLAGCRHQSCLTGLACKITNCWLLAIHRRSTTSAIPSGAGSRGNFTWSMAHPSLMSLSR